MIGTGALALGFTSGICVLCLITSVPSPIFRGVKAFFGGESGERVMSSLDEGSS